MSRGVQPRWLIGAFLALASAVREENALINYGFLLPQKTVAKTENSGTMVAEDFGCCPQRRKHLRKFFASVPGGESGYRKFQAPSPPRTRLEKVFWHRPPDGQCLRKSYRLVLSRTSLLPRFPALRPWMTRRMNPVSAPPRRCFRSLRNGC